MDHAVFVTFRWLLMFVVSGAGWLATSQGTFGERLAPAALFGAVNATMWPYLVRVVKRIQGRRRPPGTVCAASWRTYGGGKRARWREGWLVESGTGVEGVPLVGLPTPRIEPAAVTEVRERALTARELWALGERHRLLEVTFGGGRIDLAVAPGDVAAVRARLQGG